MTELALVIDGLAPTKVVPAKLPDLFAGDRLEVFGRYAGEGGHAIRLSGVVGGVRREFVYEGTFARETQSETAFLAPLWAERRVGVLLDSIRLNGANPELVGEVERLGREYRIVTPYTSHLVVEPGLWRFASRPSTGGAGSNLPGAGAPGAPGGAPGARPSTGGSEAFSVGQAQRDSASLDELALELGRRGVLPDDAPQAQLVALARQVSQELQESERALQSLGYAASGAKAVDDSVYLARLVSGRRESSQGSLFELFTRRVADKTFVLRSGAWVDQALGENPPAERRRVEAFSADYFALLASKPALAPYLALSSRLIVKLGNDVFEIFEPAFASTEPAVR